METIALISDIHGNIEALEAVHADILKRSVPTVINLGDTVSGPLWPKKTLEYLMAAPWVNIKGNHDRAVASAAPSEMGLSDRFARDELNEEEREWLNRLPVEMIFDNGILAFHGSPNNDLRYLTETVENGMTRLSSYSEIVDKLGNARNPIIACGHTHQQRCITIRDITIINPGSVGLQGFIDDGACPHKVEIGSPHARYAIVHLEGSEINVEFHAVAYDWEKAVEKARPSMRRDWISLLGKGYLHD